MTSAPPNTEENTEQTTAVMLTCPGAAVSVAWSPVTDSQGRQESADRAATS
jgi:hypothetical protein